MTDIVTGTMAVLFFGGLPGALVALLVWATARRTHANDKRTLPPAYHYRHKGWYRKNNARSLWLAAQTERTQEPPE